MYHTAKNQKVSKKDAFSKTTLLYSYVHTYNDYVVMYYICSSVVLAVAMILTLSR